MIGVIVKNGAKIVAKDVYAGDDAESLKAISQKAQQDKTLTFEVHSDSDHDWKTSFEASPVDVQVTAEKSEWQVVKAKGTATAIDYLAKKLGLE